MLANVPIGNYISDIVDKDQYKIIEFNGDFWHANPIMFEEHDVIKSFSINKSAKEIWEYDEKRLCYFKSLGYKVFVIWENQWKKIKKR